MNTKITNGTLQGYCLMSRATLLDGITALASLLHKIVLVVDEKQRLLGTLVDGDVRRALLRGATLETPLTEVMFKKPTTLQSIRELPALRNSVNRAIRYVPQVDATGYVVGLYCLDSQDNFLHHPNAVVLMAGGLGTRLGELTRDCPKPLLPVGSKPILEHILEKFIRQGFERFYLSVNYKAEMIEAHFGDGSRWGVSIGYLREDKRLGTAGSLSLMPRNLEHPVIVMNGDIFTEIEFTQLLEFHHTGGASMTSALTLYQQQIPFGVVDVENNHIVALREKPTITHFVNAGIYVLDPKRVADVPANTYYDMPDLLLRCIREGDTPTVFPLHEHWLDVGLPEELQRAKLHEQGVA